MDRKSNGPLTAATHNALAGSTVGSLSIREEPTPTTPATPETVAAVETRAGRRVPANEPAAYLWVLVALNGVVLVGQLWPAGAPPFARVVNIVFLVGALAYFLGRLWRRIQR